MKQLVVLLVLIGSGWSAVAQENSDWKKYSPPDGQFSVLFPENPKADSVPLTSPGGNSILMNVAVAFGKDIEGSSFMLTYFDAPNEPQPDALERARDGALQRAKATLIREEKISVSGYAGLEIEASGEPGTMQFRLFVVERRFYYLAYAWPKGSDRTLATRNAARYFASFKLHSRKN